MKFFMYFNYLLLPMVCALGSSLPTFAVGRHNLKEIASESLEANIRHLRSGSYLSAGNHQFRGFWTRDFAFSVPALIKLGRADVVRSHIDRIIQETHSETGAVPRYLDNYSTSKRYVYLKLGKLLPIDDPLVPNFLGGGNNKNAMVVDSNSLVLLAALDYVQATHDWGWWKKNRAKFVAIWRAYVPFVETRGAYSGMIRQGPFSDWQDSVKREGFTLYANVLYWEAMKRLQFDPAFNISADQVTALKETIIKNFYDPKTGLLRSIAGYSYISLDGNLLAIERGLISPDSAFTQQLYASLKNSVLWKGRTTTPNYPNSWIDRLPRLFGVRHYHDEFIWSWLMGLQAIVAKKMGDAQEAKKILARLSTVANRDGGISEVFQFKPDLPRVRTYAFRAEIPFSWGAAYIVKAIDFCDYNPR